MSTPSVLMAASGMLVTLGRYGAGTRQAWHTDKRSRVSFVLRGEFYEEGPTGGFLMRPGDILLKSHDVSHQDSFGRDGAALLALEVEDSVLLATRVGSMCWRQRTDTAALRLGFSLLEAAIAQDARTADIVGGDLIAAGEQGADRTPDAPAWLLRLKEELETSSLAQVEVGRRAVEAGVHPAHLSRLFRRIFGMTITDYAHAHAVRRAVGLLANFDVPLGDVAQSAGFYDQSHMNRIFSRVGNRTPGAQRTLMQRAIALSG